MGDLYFVHPPSITLRLIFFTTFPPDEIFLSLSEFRGGNESWVGMKLIEDDIINEIQKLKALVAADPCTTFRELDVERKICLKTASNEQISKYIGENQKGLPCKIQMNGIRINKIAIPKRALRFFCGTKIIHFSIAL